jgi:hypothetical protein
MLGCYPGANGIKLDDDARVGRYVITLLVELLKCGIKPLRESREIADNYE